MSTAPHEHSHYYDHIYLPETHDRNARRTHWVIGLTTLTMVVEIVVVLETALALAKTKPITATRKSNYRKQRVFIDTE